MKIPNNKILPTENIILNLDSQKLKIENLLYPSLCFTFPEPLIIYYALWEIIKEFESELKNLKCDINILPFEKYRLNSFIYNKNRHFFEISNDKSKKIVYTNHINLSKSQFLIYKKNLFNIDNQLLIILYNVNLESDHTFILLTLNSAYEILILLQESYDYEKFYV